MTTPEMSRLFRPKPLRRYRMRGGVYSWLRAHHVAVAQALGTTPWAVLVEEMARQGVQGATGAVPTANAALKVWQRVCRDVATESAASGVARGKAPNRSAAPGARPMAAEPAVSLSPPSAPPAPRSQTPAPASVNRPSPVPPGADDEEARRRRAAEETERALARLAARDERLRF